MSRAGVIQNYNEEAEKTFGYKKDEVRIPTTLFLNSLTHTQQLLPNQREHQRNVCSSARKQIERDLLVPNKSARCKTLPGAQVIGQKIEMLMPPEIAVQHDGYLQRYLDTGERHIVGTAREVPVITKDGERLNCVYVKRNLYGMYRHVERNLYERIREARELTKGCLWCT
jgi:PAS domain-containing protein